MSNWWRSPILKWAMYAQHACCTVAPHLETSPYYSVWIAERRFVPTMAVFVRVSTTATLFFFFSFHCCSRRNNSFGRNLYILCWILYLILEHVCVCTPFSLASLWCLFKIPGMELFLFYSTILAIELYGPSLFFFILSKRYARKGIK